MLENIENSLNNAYKSLKQFINDENNLITIEKISSQIAAAFQNKNKVLVCGNGGSAADSIHFAEEFTGRFQKDRRALPVISLTDAAHITCVGNDYGFEEIFAKGVEAYGKENDVFIGISTSGNSQNVAKALQLAKEQQLFTIAFLGKTGGKMKGEADLEIVFSSLDTARIQELQMLALHIIIESVERILFPQNYSEQA